MLSQHDTHDRRSLRPAHALAELRAEAEIAGQTVDIALQPEIAHRLPLEALFGQPLQVTHAL